MATNFNEQQLLNLQSSVENIKFLAAMLLHAIPHRPNERMLTWFANQVLSDAATAEKAIQHFSA